MERGFRDHARQLQFRLQRPLYRHRQPRFVGRRWQGFGLGQSRRGCCGQSFGWRIKGEWRRPALRQQWRGILARHHLRRPLQRHLARDADLAVTKTVARSLSRKRER